MVWHGYTSIINKDKVCSVHMYSFCCLCWLCVQMAQMTQFNAVVERRCFDFHFEGVLRIVGMLQVVTVHSLELELSSKKKIIKKLPKLTKLCCVKDGLVSTSTNKCCDEGTKHVLHN